MSSTNRMSSKPASGSDKSKAPQNAGDSIRKAQQWGGGSKGPVTAEDRNNENSSARH